MANLTFGMTAICSLLLLVANLPAEIHAAGFLVTPTLFREVEVVDSEDGSHICHLPFSGVPSLCGPLFGAQSPDGQSAILCGGDREPTTRNHHHCHECFLFRAQNRLDKWTTFGDMMFGRKGGSLIFLPDGKVWVMGGTDNVGDEDHMLKTTEIMDIDQNGKRLSTSYGPDLPSHLVSVCSLYISPTEIFITGSNYMRQVAFIFDLESQQFREVSVSSARQGATCGRIELSGQSYVALFGGLEVEGGRVSALTELYNIKDDTIVRGADMEIPVYGASHSDTNGSRIVISGGYTNGPDGLLWSHNSFAFHNSMWQRMDNSPRHGAVGAMMYFEQFTCN